MTYCSLQIKPLFISFLFVCLMIFMAGCSRNGSDTVVSSKNSKPTLSTIALSATPAGSSRQTDINVEVTGDAKYYKYKIGSASSVNCTSRDGYSEKSDIQTRITTNISSLSDGGIILCVLALDGLENVLADAISATWTKDTIASNAVILGADTNYNASETLNLSISASNASDIVAYRYKIIHISQNCADPMGYSDQVSTKVTISNNLVLRCCTWRYNTTRTHTKRIHTMALCLMNQTIRGGW